MGIDVTVGIEHHLEFKDFQELPAGLKQRPLLRRAISEIEIADSRSQHWLERLFLWPRGSRRQRWHWDFNIAEYDRVKWEEGWTTSRNEYPLSGPGLTVYFSPHTCEVAWREIRWGYFLTEPAIRLGVRRASYEMASAFANGIVAPSAVYFPDSASGVAEAPESLEDVIQALEEVFGPPARAIHEIYDIDEEGISTGRGYFVDDFEDLS